MFVAGRGWMLRRMGLLQREKNQKLSHPDSSSPKSIRQRPTRHCHPEQLFWRRTPAHGLRSYSSKYFKVFSEGFMAFWNLKAARLHAACPHGWPRTDKIRLSRRAPMQPALGVAPAASRLPFLPDAGTYRRRAGSRATPKGCICSPKYEEALCHHEGPSGPGATSCRVPKGNRVSPLRCQT